MKYNEENYLIYENFELIKKYYESGQYEKIISLISPSVQNIDYISYLIESHIGLNNYDTAKRLLKKLENNLSDSQSIALWHHLNGKLSLFQGIDNWGLQSFLDGIKSMEKISNQKLKNRLITDLGISYLKKGKFEDALEILAKIISGLEEGHDNVYLSLALDTMAGAHYRQGNLSLALELSLRNLDIRKSLKNDNLIGTSLNHIALIYQELGEMEKTLLYYKQAKKIFKNNKNIENISIVINNIGLLYLRQGQFSKALKNFKEANKIHFLVNSPDKIAASLNNMGTVYQLTSELKEAEKVFIQALDCWKEVGDSWEYAITLTNLAFVYYLQNKLELSLVSFLSALDTFEFQGGNHFQMASTIFNIIKVKANLKQLEEIDDVLDRFPKAPYQSPDIKAYNHMIHAKIAQESNDLETSKSSWGLALNNPDLEYRYKMQCFEGLSEIALKVYLKSQIDNDLLILNNLLNKWEGMCQENNLMVFICKINLFRANLHLPLNPSDAEKFLEKSLDIANQSGLKLYQIVIKEVMKRVEKIKIGQKDASDSELQRVEELKKENDLSLFLDSITKIYKQLIKEEQIDAKDY